MGDGKKRVDGSTEDTTEKVVSGSTAVVSDPGEAAVDDTFQTSDPDYQRTVEEMSKHCRCDDLYWPCAGVLAGGPCDEICDEVDDEEIDSWW
jgi:hypothetical protein